MVVIGLVTEAADTDKLDISMQARLNSATRRAFVAGWRGTQAINRFSEFERQPRSYRPERRRLSGRRVPGALRAGFDRGFQ